MPTNLPPEYAKIEERYRAATEIPEKIMYLEEMLSDGDIVELKA